MTASFDWADFEERLMTECTLVLTQLGKQHSEETFYVVTLTGVYRERDRNLSLPHIAANTVAAGAQNEGDFWGARWEPAEWAFPEKYLRNDQDMALERALTREAKAGSVAHWQKVETRYYRALLRITRRLRDLAPELLTVSNDFICFLFILPLKEAT